MDFDLLVVANPVWETAWLLDSIPGAGPPPQESPVRAEDGGGSALNSACALAAAGRRVLAVGRVGDDEAGQASLAALRRRGIETLIEVIPGRTTKRNHLYVERGSGSTAFRVDLPQDVVPPWEEGPPRLRDAAILLLDRLAGASDPWLRGRRGRSGLRNVLNRNSAVGTETSRRRFREALPLLDILQIPEADPDAPLGRGIAPPPLSQLEGRDRIHRPTPPPPLTAAEIESCLSAGLQVLIRTRGSRGVLIHTREGLRGGNLTAGRGGEPIEVPAAPTKLVDPTGAGDAFAAGFLDGLLEGLDPILAARRGVDWAARACRHLGARGWLDHEPPGS